VFIRHKFITNSSSTGYVAWGVIVTTDRDLYNEDLYTRRIEIRTVKKNTMAVCMEPSLSWTSTEDEWEHLEVESGIQKPIKGPNYWYVSAKLRLSVTAPKSPAEYEAWRQELFAFLDKHKLLMDEEREPDWMYIRI
jgi:hypothetical protein